MYEIGVATKPYFLSYKCKEIIHGCDALYLSKFTVNSALQCFILSFNRSKPLRKSPSMLLSSEELAKDMVRISNSASCILFSLSLYNNLVYFFLMLSHCANFYDFLVGLLGVWHFDQTLLHEEAAA